MKNSKVQSYITSQVVNYLESKLKTKISIESVDFEFIKTFVFNGIYIEDQQNDTLLYIKTFKFDVDHYNLTNNHFELSKLEFSDGFANVNKVNPSDSVYNFQFILDAFQSDETSGKTVYKINCDKIVLDRFRARYKTDSTLDTTLFNPKDMLLSDLSLKIVNALISPDLISCKLKFLQFRDKCGFEIQDLFGYFSLDSTNLSFTEFEINSNHSEIDGSFNMFKNSGSFRDARYEIAIDPTTNIDYNDLGFFRKEFQNIPYSIDLSGEFAGDLKKLDILKLVLDFGNSSHIFASGILENLDKPNKIAYDIDIQNTVTNYEDISQLPIPFLKDTFIRLPGYFTELKAVQFNANAEGTANDISTEMDLYSAIGNISGDFNTHKVDSIREFSGGLAFTQVKIPDQLTSNFPISGIFASFDFIGETVQDNISIQSTGFLNQALVNKRKLKSVITTFALNKERIEFLIEDSVNHENFTLSGILDLKDQLSLKGTLATTDFDLSQVGVVKQGHQYMLSTQTQFDIKDLKNYMAESNINSSYLKLSDGDSTLESNEISIVSVQSKTEKYIDLQSDLLNLKIDGKFLPENLGRTIEYLKYRALPEYSDTISHENCDQDFAFDLETRKLGDILNFFNLGVQISEPILAKGKISEHCNNVELVSNIPNLTLGEEKFDDIDLQLSIKDSSHFEIKVGDFHISDSVSIRDVFLGLVKIPNKVEYKFSWDNHTIPYTAGLISGDINILADRVRNQFQPSKFTVSDTVWHILANNQIEYFRDTIIVNSLVARHKSQIIGFDGIITSNPNDKLDVVLENFELENLNPFLSEFGLSLSGILDGNLRLFQPTKNIVIDSDVDIEKLAVNEYDIGKGSILTNWSTANSNLTIDANFLGSHQNSIDLKGSYQPQKDNIDVALKLNRFELATVEDFLTGVLSHLKGKLTGDLKVEGSIKSPQIDGKLAFSETEFVVDYLNTKYKLGRDEIVIKDGNAYLKDLKLIDAYGAVANLNGSFTQKKFQSFMYDFTLTNKDAFQYLNTNDYINPSYNGQAFLKNTKVNLKGSNKGISIDVKAKTAKNTQFNIPLSNPEEVTESGFITFVSPKDEKSENAEYQQKIQNIQMNFDLEITDDAKVQIIFDEKVGDVIKTTGNGEMKMEINSLGKFNLFGEYVIFKGDYLFTLQNIINKKFDIVEGSKITWNGDPYSALLDIKTIYRLKAPLSDIMSTVDSSNSYNRRVPVDCYLNLSNELMSPNIEFDIDLPSAENEVLDAFNGLISKEGEINRQFFSLLVLNRFIAPDNETAVRSNVGTTNTTEMMSHQISNWLSKISNDFDVGFKYRPGDEISDEEIELALSTQLFNDRLSIEGNFGMTGNNANATQTNNLVGDVLVEYKVKKDGSVSLKAYNSSNEFNIVDATTSQDTQGVGVLFRKDFSSFKELFRSIFKFGRKEDDQ